MVDMLGYIYPTALYSDWKSNKQIIDLNVGLQYTSGGFCFKSDTTTRTVDLK